MQKNMIARSFRLPPAQNKQLVKAARRAGISCNELIRLGLALKLGEQEARPPETSTSLGKCAPFAPCCDKANTWLGIYADADRPICPSRCACHH